MKWVNLLCLFMFSLGLTPIHVYASIDRIAIVTENQVIAPGELSGPITIQTQDESGMRVEIDETLDLTFKSSSQTGKFLNASGNEAGKTMNKNTSNRTFYYRDNEAGTYTLTITAVGRTSKKEWNTSQEIEISYNAPIEKEDSTKTKSVSTKNTSPSVASILLSAGTGLVGSPLEIHVDAKGVQSGALYRWSFGDGATSENSKGIHVYKYPGTYVVILKVEQGEQDISSRLSVKIVEPHVTFSLGKEVIKIENQGTQELDLVSWKVVSGMSNFIFKSGTIVLPHTEVIFDSEVLGFSPSVTTKFFDPTGKEVVPSGLASESTAPPSVSSKNSEGPVIKSDSKDKKINNKIGVESSTSTQAATAVLYEAPQKKKSWWQRFIDFFR